VSGIHPTAVVESGAVLAEDVEIGPYAVVGPEVELAEGVRVEAHVVLMGRTRVGAGSRISPFACLGGAPQDQDFTGEGTRLEIGANNVIREHVTIHVGTRRGDGCTRIGDGNFLMNSSHVAHDCQIGSSCIIASYVGLAGHVRVDDHAVLGAYTGVHQFSRVGESVMSASNAKLSLDAPPFAMVAGDRARLVGLNSIGLKRRGLPSRTRSQIKRAFQILFKSQLRLAVALERTREELGEIPEVERLLCFLEKSERGFCR
jgi:UDP-N-acetylglucosamine acyltransferase